MEHQPVNRRTVASSLGVPLLDLTFDPGNLPSGNVLDKGGHDHAEGGHQPNLFLVHLDEHQRLGEGQPPDGAEDLENQEHEAFEHRGWDAQDDVIG